MTADSDAPLFGKQAIGFDPINPAGRHIPPSPAPGRGRPWACYLAGPIDGLDEAEERSWSKAQRYRADRTLLLDLLIEAGMTVYAPHRAWTGADQKRRPHHAVETSNAAALATVDCLVAMLPEGVPTIGTHAEIKGACAAGLPTVVLDRRPLMDAILPTGALQVTDLAGAVAVVEGWRNTPPVATGSPIVATGSPGTVTGDGSGEALPPLIESTTAPSTVSLPFTTSEGVGGWALPTRHYIDDAALDLWVTSRITIPPGEFVDVPAGVQVELPPDTFAFIVGRSSAVRKRGILVVTGVIDVGYRGDLFVGCYNVGKHTQTIDVGERLGQLIVLPNLTQHYEPEKVDMLSPTERGTAGFGSTGGVGT